MNAMKEKKKPYVECPYCHSHLDPGERCDCQDKKPNTGKRKAPGSWRCVKGL